MSIQKFSAEEREAIWDAYGRRCAYTGKLLDVSNFHIDHIIPESLAKDSAALECKIATFDLPADFDLHGYENLLPCQPRANLQKRDLLLSSTHYFLSVAASKKAKIEAHLNRIKKRNWGGKAAILLQQHIERGDLTLHEVSEILQCYSEQPEAIFELIEDMQFADGTEVKCIAKADIEDLRDLPIYSEGKDYIDSVILINAKGEQIHVRTCKEYDFALEQGYYPSSPNSNMKSSVRFAHKCGLLRTLQAATTPQESFISISKVGVTNLELLPFSLFPVIGDELEGMELDATYQSKVIEDVLVVKSVRSNLLEIVEPRGMGQQLIEVVRADFNGDGIEDILLFEYCFATEGTLGYGGIRILTRKSIDGKFEIVQPEVDGVC